MHHHTDPTGWQSVLNQAANLAIVGGYFLVPFTVLRRMPLTAFVRISGVIFFATCGLDHAAMASGLDGGWLLANHVVQAVAVWCFVIGFARLVQAALRRRRRAQTGGDRAEVTR